MRPKAADQLTRVKLGAGLLGLMKNKQSRAQLGQNSGCQGLRKEEKVRESTDYEACNWMNRTR